MIQKQYTYNEEVYYSEDDVRQAIFENENKAFGKPETAEEWEELDVVYTEVEIPDPEPPQPTQEEIINQYRNAIQRLMDRKAQELMYDNIFTAISYENDKNPKYAAEAAAFKEWRSDVWTYGYSVLNQALAGEIEIPEISDFLESLPELVITYPEGIGEEEE